MRRNVVLGLTLAALAAGCGSKSTEVALGTIEWDRVELVAEASEPVLSIAVREGEQVSAGQVLATLDARRVRAELAAADAEIARLAAVLELLRNGARPEAIAEARARVARAQSLADGAQRELTRVRGMIERKLASPADLDRAETTARAAAAEQRAARSALELLLAGTRVEELAQSEAAALAAQARRELTAVTLDRLTVRAPRDGRIDAIPVEVGDQPARGSALVILLVGAAPHARVFVPEHLRARIAPGARFRITVEGIDSSFDGVLRYVSSSASFTPYYALTGDDASRLVYVAEIDLDADAAAGLAAGLPVRAEPIAP